MLAYFSNLLHIYGVKNCCKSAEKIELVNSARSQNQTTSPTGQLTLTPDHMKCWLSQNPFLKNHIASSLFKLLCICKPLGNPFPPASIHATCDLGCFDTCTVWQFKSNSVLRRHEQSNWTLVRTPTPHPLGGGRLSAVLNKLQISLCMVTMVRRWYDQPIVPPASLFSCMCTWNTGRSPNKGILIKLCYCR